MNLDLGADPVHEKANLAAPRTGVMWVYFCICRATKISTLEAELQAIKDSLSELLPDCTSRLDRVEGSIKEWRAFSGNLEQFLVASSGGSEVSETACKLENKEEHNGLLEKCAELRTQVCLFQQTCCRSILCIAKMRLIFMDNSDCGGTVEKCERI